MTEQVASRTTAGSNDRVRAARPRVREFPELRVVLAAVALLGAAVPRAETGEPAAAAPDRASWSQLITVDETHDANHVLVVLFHSVAARGIGGQATADLVQRIGESFGPEIARRGKAELSMGMLTDTVSAASVAKWSAADMTRLVLAFDGVLDEGRPGDALKLQALVERVRNGASADEILAGGDTLKVALRR